MPQPPLSRRRTTDGDDSLGGLVVRRDMVVVGMSMGWCGRHGQARLQTGQRIATRPPRTRPRARRRSGGGCSGSGSGSGSTRVACSAQHCIATTRGSAQPQARQHNGTPMSMWLRTSSEARFRTSTAGSLSASLWMASKRTLNWRSALVDNAGGSDSQPSMMLRTRRSRFGRATAFLWLSCLDSSL